MSFRDLWKKVKSLGDCGQTTGPVAPLLFLRNSLRNKTSLFSSLTASLLFLLCPSRFPFTVNGTELELGVQDTKLEHS